MGALVAFPADRMLEREPWVTRRHLAEHFGVTTRTITNYVQAGMPSLKLRGERRFRVSECERWMRQEAS